MAIVLLGLLFTSAFGIAQSTPADVSVNLSFYSKDNLTGMALYNTDSPPHKALSVGSKLARVTFLDDEHVRFEFFSPVHLQLFWEDGASAETAFKSVVVKVPASDIATARALLGQNYLSFESNVPVRINSFLEQSEGGQYDELIRRYIRSEYPPTIQQFVGFALHIIVEEIGMPDGTHTKQLSVLTRIVSRLEWASHSSAAEQQSRAAHTVQTIIDANDPHIVEYLRRLRLMNGRKQELEDRGWLAPIKNHQQTTPLASILAENVIRFPQRSNSCQRIFVESL